MIESGLPHLRLERHVTKPYQSPRSVQNPPPPLPDRDRAQHAAIILSQIDSLTTAINADSPTSRIPGAHGHLVVAEAEHGYALKVESLQDKRTEVVVVAADSTDSTAVLHVRRDDLSALKRKVELYADPSLHTAKKGNPLHESLVAPLRNLRLATIEDLSEGKLSRQTIDPDAKYWVELWVHGGKFVTSEVRDRIRSVVEALVSFDDGQAAPIHHFVATERDIYLARLSGSILVELSSVAPEVYRVQEAPAGLRDLMAYRMAADLDLEAIAEAPDESAATVVIIDTGVAERHPLLQPVIRGPGISVVVGKPATLDEEGHGTEMAGVAAFADLTADLLAGGPARPRAWIRNARLIDGLTNTSEDREFWPERTESAVSASLAAGELQVFNLSIGAKNENPGQRTSWSVAVDSLAHNSGIGRLFVIAAGSVDPSPVAADYPYINLAWGLDDPAQAYNAITVGAITHRADLPPDGTYNNVQALAAAGELSPYSACNLGGTRPIKPEVVVEGGNCAPDGQIAGKGVDSLSILTTSREFGLGTPLEFTWATSPAAASVSGMLASIWSANPELEPHTVRGLLVHSARWSPQMRAQFSNKSDLLRSFGYGEPDAAFAGWSSPTRPTLVFEGELAPRVEPSDDEQSKRQVHLFKVPFPSDKLLELAEHPVHLSVTLSFFVEPNETGSRYPGAMLRWDMQGPVETVEQFEKRINKIMRTPGHKTDTKSYNWDIGPDTRSRGSVQSDRCTVSAADVAGSRLVAVYPTLGWWESRKERLTATVRYSLAISVECGDVDVDLYTAIKNALSVRVEV